MVSDWIKALTTAVVKSWVTTVFGILAGLPLMIAGSGITLPPKYQHILIVIAGFGTIGLGIVAKAFNQHSTAEQVESATVKAQLDAKKP